MPVDHIVNLILASDCLLYCNAKLNNMDLRLQWPHFHAPNYCQTSIQTLSSKLFMVSLQIRLLTSMPIPQPRGGIGMVTENWTFMSIGSVKAVKQKRKGTQIRFCIFVKISFPNANYCFNIVKIGPANRKYHLSLSGYY